MRHLLKSPARDPREKCNESKGKSNSILKSFFEIENIKIGMLKNAPSVKLENLASLQLPAFSLITLLRTKERAVTAF